MSKRRDMQQEAVEFVMYEDLAKVSTFVRNLADIVTSRGKREQKPKATPVAPAGAAVVKRASRAQLREVKVEDPNQAPLDSRALGDEAIKRGSDAGAQPSILGDTVAST